jgi:hypothetical protein
MLLSVVLIALTIVATRDYVRLQSAREHFAWLSAAWQAQRVSYDTVIAGSYPLMEAEESTLWISKQSACERHVERLKYILERIRSPVSEMEPKTKALQTNHIIEQIRSVDPLAADTLVKSIAEEDKEPTP